MKAGKLVAWMDGWMDGWSHYSEPRGPWKRTDLEVGFF
jgi:hypothetical protein